MLVGGAGPQLSWLRRVVIALEGAMMHGAGPQEHKFLCMFGDTGQGGPLGG